jgi:hypothetical protein
MPDSFYHTHPESPSGPDYLGRSDLAALDIDDLTIDLLLQLTGGAPVHRDQLTDLLWQVEQEGADR